jgi:hypothetical protein
MLGVGFDSDRNFENSEMLEIADSELEIDNQ